jgi:hypothetical protein
VTSAEVAIGAILHAFSSTVQQQRHLSATIFAAPFNLKPMTDEQNWLVTDDSDDSKMVLDRRESVTARTAT